MVPIVSHAGMAYNRQTTPRAIYSLLGCLMKKVRLLHLTDLHYGSNPGSFQDWDKTHLDPGFRENAFRNLDRLLQCFRGNPFDVISVGGDITTQGQPAGYDEFAAGALPRLQELVRRPAAICVVPGNHDVTWNLDVTKPDYFSQKFSAYSSFVEKSGGTSALIPTSGVPTSALGSIQFSKAGPGPVFIDDEERFLVLCINSSMRCGERNRYLYDKLYVPAEQMRSRAGEINSRLPPDDPNGSDLDFLNRQLAALCKRLETEAIRDIPHVTQVQLDELGGQLDQLRSSLKGKWDDLIKIAVMHHHVVPFDYQVTEYKPFEITADASSVLETLASFRFQLVLTGHKHQPYVQDILFREAQLLVIGGMTVGGEPVRGFGQGIRHLEIDRDNGQLRVRVADLPCDFRGDIRLKVQDLIQHARDYVVYIDQPPRRITFPKNIENAVQHQIYQREFYRSNMVFDIHVKWKSPGTLLFTTTLSYNVTNRTDQLQTWHTRYAFHNHDGRILELHLGSREFDPEQPDFKDGRGLSISSNLAPHETLPVSLKAEESWPDIGTTFCTSYYPSTDLKVILRSDVTELDFRFEVLYFWDVWPETRQGAREVFFDRGILPYQGVRLHWRRP